MQALLIVEMGPRACGFRCEDVLEVLPRVQVTEVPDMPAEVLGVINARGKVVPVIDPRARLANAPSLPPYQYLVLLKAPTSTGAVAVAVDRVRDVVSVNTGEIAYPGERGEPSRKEPGRSGVVRIGHELVVTLGAADVYHEPG